jgi:hypothetical protein
MMPEILPRFCIGAFRISKLQYRISLMLRDCSKRFSLFLYFYDLPLIKIISFGGAHQITGTYQQKCILNRKSRNRKDYLSQ